MLPFWSNTIQINLDKLQAAQNFAGKIVGVDGKFDHITPSVKRKQAPEPLNFRLAVFVLKCMTECAPGYLTSKLVKRSADSTKKIKDSEMLSIPLFYTALLVAKSDPPLSDVIME